MMELLITGWLIGLAGSLHCVAMCGAIVTSLSINLKQRSFVQSVLLNSSYNLGRILTYMTLGIIAGGLGETFATFGLLSLLRILAALLLIGVGFYLLNWWRGFLRLEHLGQRIWRKVAPLTRRIDPGRSIVHALFAGTVWGLIPCGLVYSAMGIATVQGGIFNGSMFMLAFGSGTFFPMMLMGVGFSRVAQWLKWPTVRYGLAVIMIGFGVWNMWQLMTQQHLHHPDTDSTLESTNHHH